MAIKQQYDDDKKHIHVLSYGGGTQSTAMLLMALKGEINGVIPDYIIFSDTGWEPKSIYEWVYKVNDHIKEKYGKEIIFTNGGNLIKKGVRGKALLDKSRTFLPKNNKSGYIGVSFSKSKNKWGANLSVNKKTIHIGYFQTRKEAARARREYLISYYRGGGM